MNNKEASDLVNGFDHRKSIRKSRTGAVIGAIASVASASAAAAASQHGLPPEVAVGIVGTAAGGIVASALNALKHQFPRAFGWL